MHLNTQHFNSKYFVYKGKIMQGRKAEVIRIAKELGLPVNDNSTITDIVLFLSHEPNIAPELTEALNAMLNVPHKATCSAAA